MRRTTITTSKAMLKMNRIIKDMKVIDMSIGSITVTEDMEAEVNSLRIATISHVDPSSVSHAINMVIDMRISHTRTKPISNFVLAVALVITY